MLDGLNSVRSTLATLTDKDLEAFQVATETGPQLCPELIAFLAHACDWERERRAGQIFTLRGPHSTVGPEELDSAFITLSALHVIFEDNTRLRELLEATNEALQTYPPGRPV